jgi:hypothetical protein
MTRSRFTFAGPLASAPMLIAALLAGCASAPSTAPTPPAPPEVPAALRPAAGETLFLEALATGVQIYECTTKPDDAATYVWIFRSPEASLADAAGKRLGKHYAGPTWESLDGSTVVGEVKARDPGPDPQAIPWLLLTAKLTTGTGVFAQTKPQRATMVTHSHDDFGTRPLFDAVAPVLLGLERKAEFVF